APPQGAALVLPGRRIADAAGELGRVSGADPGGRARRPDGSLLPPADRERPEGPDGSGAGLGDVGRLGAVPPPRSRPGRRLRPARLCARLRADREPLPPPSRFL